MANNLLLGGEEDLIEIVLYYKVKKNKRGYRQFLVLEEDEAKKKLEAGDEDIQTLETKWKPSTWATNQSLLKQSMTYNSVSGQTELDWNSYQQNVFKFCLQGWNVTDDDGNPIPPDLDNIGMLPAIIARTLINKYDESLQMDEEEKKE